MAFDFKKEYKEFYKDTDQFSAACLSADDASRR